METFVERFPHLVLHVFGGLLLALAPILFWCLLKRTGALDRLSAATHGLSTRSRLEQMLVLVLLAGVIVYGSTKDGENSAFPRLRVRPMAEAPSTPGAAVGGPAVLPSVRPPTPSDYAAGFALVRIGTGEAFDFSPPEGAEVHGRWARRGAACDWTPVEWGNGDEGGFRLGSDRLGRLAAFSFGTLRPSVSDRSAFVSPLEASLGVVPAANWSMIPRSGDEEAKSLFWTLHTLSNTFVATWSDVLLDRASDRPVSFQAEFLPGGGVVFRYDLSRLPEDVVTNLVVGISNGGAGRVFTALARSTTSLRWAWLDPARAGDPDPDGDRVPTEDEVLVHGTDPYSADTDGDGLSDFAEIAAGGDPLDPYSNGSAFSDGFAAALGGLDPLSSPPGSTNTVYEHILHSGTADGAFDPPASGASTAVLRVTATGEGVVDLLVDGSPVPLLGAAGGRVVPLALPRGRRLPLRLRANGPAPALAFASDDFAAGELPTDPCGEGWIAFPRTDATPACFHSEGGTRLVSVPICDGLPDLRATWESVESMYLEISNAPPRAAVLRSTAEVPWGTVRYTLSHPDRLFGGTVFLQTVRTCPEPEPPPPPPGPEPPDPGDSGGDEEDPHHHLCACGCGCEVGDGGGSCSCGCAAEGSSAFGLCTCRAGGGADGADGPEDAPPGDTDSDDPATSRDVLVLHRTPADARTIRLDVPRGRVEGCTCPCPEHRTSHVSLWSSSRLAVEDASGGPFSVAYETQDVVVRPVCPSAEPGDARLAFSRNGTLFETRSFTVLGLDVRHPTLDLDGLAARDPSFGVPMVVAADAERGLELLLRTDVDLGFGRISLAFEGATAPFTAWRWAGGAWIPLCSSSGGVTAGVAAWRAALGVADAARDTPIRVTAPVPGSCTLVFSYEGTVGGRRVACAKRRRITAVAPPLLADHDRDGVVDGADVARDLSGRPFLFWTNGDVWEGDMAFGGRYDDYSRNVACPLNGEDGIVNGRADLVNLLPLAICVKPFLDAWGDRASIRIRATETATDRVRRCYSAVPHAEAYRLLESDAVTAGDTPGPLHAAHLGALTRTGDELSDTGVDGVTSGFVLLEARGSWVSTPVELVVELDGREVLVHRPRLDFCDVDYMYRWLNLRAAAGGVASDVVGMAQYELDGPQVRPDSSTDGTHVVFVHGYNVNEREARMWGRAVFKRLWWAGMESAFSVVAWRGDDSQTWRGLLGWIAPDYQANVEHAFATAPALAAAVNALPGRKYVMAHSLGNMLVSAAAQDQGLLYERYFMLNAAVPVEAYDPVGGATDATRARMTPEAWAGYPNRVRAAHWHALFPDGDPRRGLTWKGRFVDVANTVNYYSSEEEVLKCGNGESRFSYMRSYAWYNQERYKGTKSLLQGALNFGRNEGGWAFNQAYDVSETTTAPSPPGSSTPPQTVTTTRHAYPGEVGEAACPDDQLREEPFFGSFADTSICSSNRVPEISAALRAQLLADAIPAESLVAGFTAVPVWVDSAEGNRNNNMATGNFKDLSMAQVLSSPDWVHSYFIQAPYSVVHKLYKDMVKRIKENH